MSSRTIQLVAAVTAAIAIVAGIATLAYQAGQDDAEQTYEVRLGSSTVSVDAEPALRELADALDDIRVEGRYDDGTASVTITSR